MTKTLALALISATVFSGCFLDIYGREEIPDGFTSVRFTRAQATQPELLSMDPLSSVSTMAIALPGGIMIYMVGTNGTPFRNVFKLMDESDTSTRVLPNGSYRAYAVGWGAPEFSTPVKCGLGEGGGDIVLGGGSKTIAITMDATSCADAAFGPASALYNSEFKTLSMFSCSTAALGSVSGAGSSSACMFSGAGTLGSMKVQLRLYSSDGVNPPTIIPQPMVSGCTVFTTGSIRSVSTTFEIPVGSSTGPQFSLEILGFSDGACATPVTNFGFPKGLSDPTSIVAFDTANQTQIGSGATAAKVYDATTATEIYLGN